MTIRKDGTAVRRCLALHRTHQRPYKMDPRPCQAEPGGGRVQGASGSTQKRSPAPFGVGAAGFPAVGARPRPVTYRLRARWRALRPFRDARACDPA